MRAHGSTRAVSWLACAIGVCVIVAVLRSQPTRADFIYVDFNDTTGLLFNQNSTTTSCDDSSWVRHSLRVRAAPVHELLTHLLRCSTRMLTLLGMTTDTTIETIMARLSR